MYTPIVDFNEQNRLINLLASYGIKNPVLSLFRLIPRHFFIPKENQYLAYSDRAVSIGFSQTNSQPSLTAMTLQSLELKGGEKVLEVGTGSGFQTALLAHLAKEVISLEIVKKLAQDAKKRLKKLNLTNVKVFESDGTLAYLKFAPYDVIIVNAAFVKIPKAMCEQIKEGGLLVMPVGEINNQELSIYKKIEGELFKQRRIAKVSFVPLMGKYGLQ